MMSRRRVRNWMMAAVVGAGTVATLGAATIGVPGVAGAANGSGAKSYYVSLGDSYSVGYQPGKGSTFGYTGYVAARRTSPWPTLAAVAPPRGPSSRPSAARRTFRPNSVASPIRPPPKRARPKPSSMLTPDTSG